MMTERNILIAFILGFPANEIVFPIILMSYLSTGNLVEVNDILALKEILIQNRLDIYNSNLYHDIYINALAMFNNSTHNI